MSPQPGQTDGINVNGKCSFETHEEQETSYYVVGYLSVGQCSQWWPPTAHVCSVNHCSHKGLWHCNHHFGDICSYHGNSKSAPMTGNQTADVSQLRGKKLDGDSCGSNEECSHGCCKEIADGKSKCMADRGLPCTNTTVLRSDRTIASKCTWRMDKDSD